MRWRVGLVVATVLLAATACVIPMADLGGASSSARAINDAGVVVGSAQRPDGSWRAFKRWTDDTVVELEAWPDATRSDARAINGDGVAVGSVTRSDGTRAVSWAPDGQVTDLGAGAAVDINDAGMILILGPLGDDAVFDPTTGQLVAPPTSDPVNLSGLNNHGEVVGWIHSDHGDLPMRWNVATGEVVDLSLTLDEWRFWPEDINDAGTIIGHATFGDQEFWDPAIVLAGTTHVLSLGAGADEQAEARAFGLDETNTVVGTGGDGHPFRWTPETGAVSLPGDVIGSANAINAAGTVVGSGSHVEGGTVVGPAKAMFFVFPSA